MSANARTTGPRGGRRLGRLLLAAVLVATGCIAGPATDPDSPVLFDIGGNNREVIVSFGDGIAAGEGATDSTRYRDLLHLQLIATGRPELQIVNEGAPGTTSADGTARIGAVLNRDRPAALLLLYGENDPAVNPAAGDAATQRGNTVAALQSIIGTARANRTLVVVSTLPPVCGPARADHRDRTALLNEEIRTLVLNIAAVDIGVVLVDAWRDFIAASPPDGCTLIDQSGERPNDDGYGALAATWAAGLKHVAW